MMRDTRVKNLIQRHESILQIEPTTNIIVKEWQILPSEISKELGIYEIWKALKNPYLDAYILTSILRRLHTHIHT